MNNKLKTLMCTLHDYLSSKVRFIHTSTVTGSDSCSGQKKYAYASRTSCLIFIPNMLVSAMTYNLEIWLIQKIQIYFFKSFSFLQL